MLRKEGRRTSPQVPLGVSEELMDPSVQGQSVHGEEGLICNYINLQGTAQENDTFSPICRNTSKFPRQTLTYVACNADDCPVCTQPT